MQLVESVLKFHEHDHCGGAAATLIHPHFAIACFHSFSWGIPSTIFLETSKGNMVSGSIKYHQFPLLDVMILELSKPVTDVKPIQFNQQTKVDDECWVFGFPLINRGRFCAVPAKITLEIKEKYRHVYRFVKCPKDKFALKGTSGGSVVNRCGKLIAMQQSTDLPPGENAFYGSGVNSNVIYNVFMKIKGGDK